MRRIAEVGLALLEGVFHLSEPELIAAVVIASGSNNLMKAIYAAALGRNRFTGLAAGWLVLLFLASMAYVFFLL